MKKIRTGNSIIRNPILVSYAAKGMLPDRGLGSGIKRALEAWPEIDFADNRDRCLFTATVHRTAMKSSEKILSLLKIEPELAAREIARKIGISPRAVEKQIAKLTLPKFDRHLYGEAVILRDKMDQREIL